MRLLGRVLLGLFCSVIVLVAVVLGLAFWPLRDRHPVPQMTRGVLAISGARVYRSPGAPAIPHATVLMIDGKIAAVGEQVAIPREAKRLACDGCVVTAGFWNAHVHFTERKWAGAESADSSRLATQVADMLTSRGFTTVVDLGSNPRDTVPLRRRIEHGEIAGPKIYTAGSAQYPPGGIPFYLRDTLPPSALRFLPQPKSPAEAARVERLNLAFGADLLKLFTGSYIERGKVLPMPVENARAAVAVAHGHGQLAFAHESNRAGATVALESGVDVLAHAIDTTDGVDDAFLARIAGARMAMIPTLKMFRTTVTTRSEYLDPIYLQVRRFHELGGTLIFGTDVGYMTDYDTAGEFAALARSGLDGREILRMLTTAPAERFGVAGETGTLDPGKAADVVVLDQDPMADVATFATVNATVRAGRVIWKRR